VKILVLRGLALLLAATSPVAGQGDSATLQITYLGNEGFLVQAEGRAVLLDALFGDGLEGYPVVPADLRAELEAALPPFDQVRLVTASHYHGDHFDPYAVVRFLVSAPEATFLSTGQAADLLRVPATRAGVASGRYVAVQPPEGEWRERVIAGIPVVVFDLHHGRSRDVRNLGVLVDLDGVRVLHLGDTEATLADLGVYDLPERGVDVALVPYWHLLSEEGRHRIRKGVSAGIIVPMHWPAEDAPASWFGDAGNLDGLVAELGASVENSLILVDAGKTATLRVPVSAGE
jgi:L-ascorbate metabolism protein UlaG (beta-lactamase superfamily)